MENGIKQNNVRIMKELKLLNEQNVYHIVDKKINEDQTIILNVKFMGPFPYERPLFLKLEIPPTFPFKAPSLQFSSQIYHPNIDQGRICLDVLSHGWRPTCTIIAILDSLFVLLSEPNCSDPLSPEIAQVYLFDRDRYLRIAATEDHSPFTLHTQTLYGKERENQQDLSKNSDGSFSLIKKSSKLRSAKNKTLP